MDKKTFKQQLLDEIYAPYRKERKCLVNSFACTKIVIGEGNPDSSIMFIGEAPGREEDEQGRPFVGRSGQLLNKALKECDIQREDVFITNIVKCRPPNNRTPLPPEIDCFKKLLISEIKIIRPKVICTLGSCALNGLLNDTFQITKIHGKPLHFDGVTLVPLYHPAYILRNPVAYKDFVHDIKKAINLAY